MVPPLYNPHPNPFPSPKIMTTGQAQSSPHPEEDPQSNQAGNGQPKEALRFQVKDGESPQSLEEAPSPVAENVKPETQDNGGPGEALRVPMPDRETPQPAPGPEGKPQPSGLRQPLAVATPLPWFTWFLGLLAATILFLCGLSLWDTLNGLWERSVVLGMAGLVLAGLLVLVTIAVAIREWQAMERINTLEEIRQQAERSLTPADDVGDLDLARKAINGLVTIYSSREDTRGGSQRLAEKQGEVFAASSLMILAETELLKALDDDAEKVIRDTTLRIATETAFMPWPLADVLLVFLSSLQMFRRIAKIYGGRPGVVASWTLSRKVLAQLVVAGALSEGGPWIDAVVGHQLLNLARPIAEGITNGSLMARSGVTAMKLCRPLPFRDHQRPSSAAILGFANVKEALFKALGKK